MKKVSRVLRGDSVKFSPDLCFVLAITWLTDLQTE